MSELKIELDVECRLLEEAAQGEAPAEGLGSRGNEDVIRNLTLSPVCKVKLLFFQSLRHAQGDKSNHEAAPSPGIAWNIQRVYGKGSCGSEYDVVQGMGFLSNFDYFKDYSPSIMLKISKIAEFRKLSLH